MNIHKNAPLTPKGRADHGAQGGGRRTEPKADAAISSIRHPRRLRDSGHARSARKAWIGCAIAPQDLIHCRAKQRPPRSRIIEALRRQRYTGKHIAAEIGVSPATVSRILRRLGFNRIRDLKPPEPARRYERPTPGEMIHIDIKKLGRFDRIGHRITGDRTGQSNSRGVGWEFVHVCIDDHSRVAFSEINPDEKNDSAVPFLKATVAYYKSLGVTVTRVMTDNG